MVKIKKDLFLPDYDNSILSLTNSLLKNYGINNFHKTLPELDNLLQKNYRNVVLIIFDGMGSDMLNSNLSESSFLARHKIMNLSSVFPCTTTAAITSIESGLSPIEHGWLGWSCYFKEVGECVNLFNNGISRMAEVVPASGNHLANTYMGFKNVLSMVAEASEEIKTFRVSPFSEYFADTCEKMCEHIEMLCANSEKKLIYGYHSQPDHDMHDFGCYDDKIKSMISEFNNRVEEMCEKLEDTLVIITADHGLTNIKMLCIEDYPKINECLSVLPSLEPRCVSFFIKDSHKDVFADRFNNEFAEKFILFTKEEFLQKNFLGDGIPHKKSLDFIGDYIAVATDDIAIWYRDSNGDYNDFKAAHAGLIKDEMLVPLIIIEK